MAEIMLNPLHRKNKLGIQQSHFGVPAPKYKSKPPNAINSMHAKIPTIKLIIAVTVKILIIIYLLSIVFFMKHSKKIMPEISKYSYIKYQKP